MSAPAQEFPQRQQQVVAWVWIFLLSLATVDFFLLNTSELNLSPKTPPLMLSVCALLTVVSAFYGSLRKDFGIYIAAQLTNQMIVGMLLLAILSYLGAWLNYPFIDDHLTFLDNIPHLEWHSYASMVNNCTLLSYLFLICYNITGPEIPLLLVLLFLLKRHVSLQRFCVAFLGSGCVTIVLAMFWPARVAYEYYAIAPEAFPHIAIADSLHYLQDYYAMRNHWLLTLPVTFEGLVEFPSFHSTIAVLVIAAAYSLSSRPLRYLLIALNVVMLLSTPVEGGHYFIDTIAGTALGLIAVWLAAKILPSQQTVQL